ncbi:MAG: acyltransferase [Aquabacterium sp.]|uniref:acyltransferase family protein n=1 Tax=Aquabacterium sp. TaxID=1872578 RepID=UPI00120441FA|nr:acyltransferase [Aquabacterium sp.]TAK97441.1 MAG: acyltransferase [Aquabacterium sp.]
MRQATPSPLPSAEPQAAQLFKALRGSRIPGLDFLRAISVLMVLVDHSGMTWLGPIALFNGGIGVEIFFVLSGFLITWMLLHELDKHQDINLLDFYRRRAARLLPAFYAYVLLGITYLTLRHLPVPWDAVVAACLYVLNYYQGLTGAATHFLSPCWSLAVEEQFYLLWPFALLALFRHRIRMVPFMCTVIVAVWLCRPILMWVFDVPDAYLYRALETRADHLAVGCVLAMLLRQQFWLEVSARLARRKWVLPALAALLITSATLQQIQAYKYSLGYALEPLLIGFMIPLVILRSSENSWFAKLANFRSIVTIGQISYGMYLVHPLLMYPIRMAVERATGQSLLGVGVSIVAVIVFGYVSFTWFETPVRARLRGKAH